MSAVLSAQRGRLPCWLAVAYGAGVGLYFALRFEPGAALWAAVAAGCAAAWALGLAGAPGWAAWRGIGAVLAGLATAGAHANLGAEPVLGFRYYGPIEGRVVALDLSQSGVRRVTLEEVRLDWTRVGQAPARVRVSLHGGGEAQVGARVGVTGHLSPPSGPVEPGGFDFSRHAWFQRLGAVGYARAPMVVLRPPDGLEGAVGRLRHAISDHVAGRIGGAAGGIAAAILTGDRSHIPEEATLALRRTNLSHLLAISGLHMGLLTGFVFACVRLGVLALPGGSAMPARTAAALAALAAATLYLGISGGNVATQRAFVMVAVAMGAVIAGRRAITLRGVAIAALVVLALDPSAILGPGFQMSFSATAALVCVFGALRRPAGAPRRVPRWARGIAALALSSAVAGAATAPFAAAHFNMMAQYGLAANLAAVPAMGMLVMPSAVVAALLWPVGLEGIGLAGMRIGIEWVLAVAGTVEGWPGAVRPIPSPPGYVLPGLALSGAVLLLLRGRARLVGAAPAAALVLAWSAAERPALLVEETGALIGAMTEGGRGLTRPKGAGFAARIWLENDADGADQARAAERLEEGRRIEAGGMRVLHRPGKRGAAEAGALCEPGLWIVLTEAAELTGGCAVSHPGTLRRSGALAVIGGRVVSARDLSGVRPWNAARYRDREARPWEIAPGGRIARAGE